MKGALGILLAFFGYTLIYCGVKDESVYDEVLAGFRPDGNGLLGAGGSASGEVVAGNGTLAGAVKAVRSKLGLDLPPEVAGGVATAQEIANNPSYYVTAGRFGNGRGRG